MRRDLLRKGSKTQMTFAKFMEAINGNIANSIQEVLTMMRRLTRDTKQTKEEALVEEEEAEASLEVAASAGALAEASEEVNLENSSTDRTINFTNQIRPLLVDHHQLFTLINRAMLLTAAQPCQHPEDIMANIITEMRQLIASLQLTLKLKILGNSWRTC